MPRSTRSLVPAFLAAAGLAVAASLPAVALADPPSWAGQGRDQGDEQGDGRDEHGHGRGHDKDRREDRRDDRRDDRQEDRRDDRREEWRGDRPDRDWHEDRDRDWRPHDYGRHVGHYYRGYYGDDWDDDYGIVSSGRCNTDAVLGVVGAVTGGMIGNASARGGDRGVATVLGAIAGGVIGTAIGSSIDDGDRACMGHALELAPIGRPVIWLNPHSHLQWRLIPVRDVSPRCREFDLYREGRHSGRERVMACRRGRGDWEFGRP